MILSGLTASASAADAGAHKNIIGLGSSTLIISNVKIENIMKIFKCLVDFGLLIKGIITKTIKNKTKEKQWISWYVIRCIRC